MTLMSLMLHMTVLLTYNLFLFFQRLYFLNSYSSSYWWYYCGFQHKSKIKSSTYCTLKDAGKLHHYLSLQGGWIIPHHQASIISLKTLQLKRGHVSHQGNGQPSQKILKVSRTKSCQWILHSCNFAVSWWLQWDIFSVEK